MPQKKRYTTVTQYVRFRVDQPERIDHSGELISITVHAETYGVNVVYVFAEDVTEEVPDPDLEFPIETVFWESLAAMRVIGIPALRDIGLYVHMHSLADALMSEPDVDTLNPSILPRFDGFTRTRSIEISYHDIDGQLYMSMDDLASMMGTRWHGTPEEVATCRRISEWAARVVHGSAPAAEG